MVQSFGQVSVPAGGTPVRATANLSAPTQAQPVFVQSFMVQAAPENTGLVYVLSSEADPGNDRVTRTKVLAILAVPGTATAGPFYASSYTMPNASGAVDLREIWIDVGVNGDDAIVSGTHNQPSRYV